MERIRNNGSTSNWERFRLLQDGSGANPGYGKTALTSASSGLIISTIADNESAATTYTVAGSTIETITTLGTFAAPTATKVRFKEVDATNHPGLYEVQIADARYAVSGAKQLKITISGVTGVMPKSLTIQLTTVNVDSANNFMTGTNGVTQTYDGNNFLKVDVVDIAGTASAGTAGYVGLDWAHINAPTTAQALSGTTISASSTPTAAQVATAVWQDVTAGDFTIAHSIGKALFIDNVVPGGTGGFQTTNVAVTLPTIPANWISAAGIAANALNGKGDWLLSSGYTAPTNLTVAQIATGVWQDVTAGDFTVASSIGKALYIANIAPGATGGLQTTNVAVTLPTIPTNWITAGGINAGALNGKGDWVTSVSAGPTAAQIATAVWQDVTAGDFTVAHSIGKCVFIDNIVPGVSSGHAIVGSKMDFVDAPNATAITAIQSGLSKPATAQKIDFTTTLPVDPATGTVGASLSAALVFTGAVTSSADSTHSTVGGGAATLDGNTLDGAKITIVSGTAFGQTRTIIGHSGGDLTFDRPWWNGAPDNTSHFVIVAGYNPLLGGGLTLEVDVQSIGGKYVNVTPNPVGFGLDGFLQVDNRFNQGQASTIDGSNLPIVSGTGLAKAADVTTIESSLTSIGTAVGTIGTNVTGIASAVTTIGTNVGTILSRIPATLFGGITSLGNWLRTLARSDSPDTTALSEINATTHSIAGSFDATVDSLQELAAGGGGSGGLSGPSSVTLAFHDASNAPLQNVEFTITGQGVGPRSASDGTAAFGLPDGTYTVVTAPLGLTMFANATLVVSGDTTQTITGTTATIPAAPSPAQATGYAYIYDGSGNLLLNKKFYVKLVRSNTGHDVWSNKLIPTTKSASGSPASVTLEQGATYQASVDAKTWSAAFTVPAATTYNLTELVGTL